MLILKRAQDDLKREEELKQKAKDDFLKQKVAPLKIDGLNASKWLAGSRVESPPPCAIPASRFKS